MTGPLSALAQESDTPPPLIQDAPPEVPAERAPAPEAPPAPEPEAAPAPEPEAAPAPAPEPEAPAEPPAAAPEPAPAPEPEAPPPAPAPEPAPAPAPEPPAAPVQAAPDSGPPVDAPEGNPAELPEDAGTQNDLSNGSSSPAAGETAPEAPAAPTAPAAEPPPAPPAAATPPEPPAGAGETPAAPPAPAPDAAPATPPAPGAEPPAPGGTPAAPTAPPTAPTDPALRAPGGAPVAPGTPPSPPAPAGAVPTPPPGTAPEQPAPGAAPAQQSGAVAPPPAETPQPVAADIQTAPVPEGGVASSDARVQQLAAPVEVRPITSERGQRLEAAPQAVLPNNVEVVQRVGDRDILSLVGAGIAGAAAGAAAAYFIRSDDSDRLVGNSREVYYEQLPRGLTRQVITRPNGVQVVTIENEYGDVIQRSRIAPDGRETVLFYDPYAEDDQRPDYYYDAGADLPPLRLEIPRDRYIVDVSAPDEQLYYDTLVAPPVETVERIYSLNEVRRSPRIRDKVRRIDLNTINFAFGSAEIEQGEVDNLQALADAVKRVVDRNPGEVFLLEGHTDAVGSNVANLALSDRRAEAVASALTEYFEIPPENLVTQGYGEEDLKVDTQEANRENRRVTLRRITALVKPVETSQAN
ncbi:OmpA family protein [Aureimonas flava]|uniref:OmpA family protein n=2 Tax=Aureimonas flava TaxID=2320271 RepID=A0A3A1WPF7_9HYPH|nr:OmpA family protein [Aureimonas flava]